MLEYVYVLLEENCGVFDLNDLHDESDHSCCFGSVSIIGVYPSVKEANEANHKHRNSITAAYADKRHPDQKQPRKGGRVVQGLPRYTWVPVGGSGSSIQEYYFCDQDPKGDVVKYDGYRIRVWIEEKKVIRNDG